MAGINRQSDRSEHEGHRRPSGCFGECAGCSSRSESRLAALSAECCRDVATLAALQQDDNDDEEANQDVDGGDDVDHKILIFLEFSDFARAWLPMARKSHGAEGGI